MIKIKDIEKFKKLFQEIGLDFEYGNGYDSLIPDEEIEEDLIDQEIIIENKDGEQVIFYFNEADGKYKNFMVVE